MAATSMKVMVSESVLCGTWANGTVFGRANILGNVVIGCTVVVVEGTLSGCAVEFEETVERARSSVLVIVGPTIGEMAASLGGDAS